MAIEQRLAQRLVLRDGLQNLSLRSHIANGPLAQPRAGEPEDVAACLEDVALQASLHLVVSEECHVARMCDGQDLPVAKQRYPGLKEACEYVKLEVGNEVVAGQVNGGLQGHGLQAGDDGMYFVQLLSEDLPGNQCAAIQRRRCECL